MKKKELIRVIDDGYTAIIKVWKIRTYGGTVTFETVHPRI